MNSAPDDRTGTNTRWPADPPAGRPDAAGVGGALPPGVDLRTTTGPHAECLPSSGPPARRLPGEHDHVELLRPLGHGRGCVLWAGRSMHFPGLVVVEFLLQPPADLRGGGSGPRFVLRLPAASDASWWPPV